VISLQKWSVVLDRQADRGVNAGSNEPSSKEAFNPYAFLCRIWLPNPTASQARKRTMKGHEARQLPDSSSSAWLNLPYVRSIGSARNPRWSMGPPRGGSDRTVPRSACSPSEIASSSAKTSIGPGANALRCGHAGVLLSVYGTINPLVGSTSH
jgi:hypothetical protein